MATRFCTLSSLVALGLLAGCGGPDDEIKGPKGSVSGKVTGASVGEGISVVFTEAGERGFLAQGTTDADGNYKLTSKLDGQLPVGKYKITVLPKSTDDISTESTDYEKMMSGGGKTTASTPASSSVPERFQDASTSGLEFEVKEGANTYNIDLSK